MAADFLAAGFRLERNTVMTASAVREPPHPNRDAVCRPLESEDDWRQSVELRLRCNSFADPVADRAFFEGRTAAVRRLVDAGRGAWFGAFLDGRLVAELGLFTDGRGVARYQAVETDPAERRKGLAGTLVCHAGRYGIQSLAARTLVMVANPAADAIRIYRSIGFSDTETQLTLERPPNSS